MKSTLINLKSSKKITPEIIRRLKEIIIVDEYVVLKPILPIISGNGKELPFSTLGSLLDYAEKNKLDLGDVGIIYEICQSGLSKSELINKMKSIIETIESSIEKGLEGTIYKDRILHKQSHLIEKAEREGKFDDFFHDFAPKIFLQMLESSGENKVLYDAILIDEAQDFDETWLLKVVRIDYAAIVLVMFITQQFIYAIDEPDHHLSLGCQYRWRLAYSIDIPSTIGIIFQYPP